MSKIISVHSFRGGTGKSNTTANVTALLAREGLRVGVIDTDIQSPGIHVLFGPRRLFCIFCILFYILSFLCHMSVLLELLVKFHTLLL